MRREGRRSLAQRPPARSINLSRSSTCPSRQGGTAPPHGGSLSEPSARPRSCLSEVVTDLAPTYLVVLEELLPTAWHRTDRYANNRIEADNGRQGRLRPMSGLRLEQRPSRDRRIRLRPERSPRALRAGSRGAGEAAVGRRLRRVRPGDVTPSPRSRLHHARTDQTQHDPLIPRRQPPHQTRR
jgi:hypothetical protein